MAVHVPPRHEHTSVLLVDDDEDTRMLLSAALRAHGFTVDCVDSAASCLAHLADSTVAIVVTDVQMPGMSGLDLCIQLRAQHPATAVVVLSGLTNLETAALARERGAHSFVAKPVKASVLADELQRVLGTRDSDPS